jgi:hypothetical protein
MKSRHRDVEQPGSSTKSITRIQGNRLSVQWLRQKSIGWLLIGLVLVCLMLTNQSLWIDEGFSLAYADEPTVARFTTRLLTSPGSEPLMPLGMLSTWVGAKVFGRSELGLRTVSVLWAAVAVFVMWRVGIIVGMPWLAAVFACHAFLWYYASEARPYSMTIALGACLLYSLVIVVCPPGGERRGPGALLIFGTLLCATHALAAIPFLIVAFIVVAVLLRQKWRPTVRGMVTSLISLSALFLLAAYYVPPFLKGDEIAWRKQWASSSDSALFSIFELFGFMGFSPGRNALRELTISGGMKGAIEGLVRPSSLGLLFLASVYVLVFGSFLRVVRAKRPATTGLVVFSGVVVIGTIATAVAASFLLSSSFWGRHLAALFPFVVFTAVVAAGSEKPPESRSPNAVTLLLAGGLLASSFLVRFDPAHGRDDYRSAARLATSAAKTDRTVWWAANPSCAQYYGVEFCPAGSREKEGHCVLFVSNQDLTLLVADPLPDVIILSKPDLFDTVGDLTRFLTENGYQQIEDFVAFRVYEPG